MAESACLEKFMAHDAVQDLLDRVWFGGVEPCAQKWKVLTCFMFPFLVPALMTPSRDKLGCLLMVSHNSVITIES